MCYTLDAEPHSSVGSVADLRTGGRWFDPQLDQYSFQELMIVIATISFLSTATRCFDNGYVGNPPVAWREYCAGLWIKRYPGELGQVHWPPRCDKYC